MGRPALRMRALRERRRAQGLRELRMLVPDTSSGKVRERLAAQSRALSQPLEDEAMSWIEAVSEFDEPGPGV